MNSGELLDDFDVVFATVVNQIHVRKNSFSFACKTNRSTFRYLMCIWICGSFGLPPPSQVWAYPLGESLHARKLSFLLWGSGHRQWKTELSTSS